VRVIIFPLLWEKEGYENILSNRGSHEEGVFPIADQCEKGGGGGGETYRR